MVRKRRNGVGSESHALAQIHSHPISHPISHGHPNRAPRLRSRTDAERRSSQNNPSRASQCEFCKDDFLPSEGQLCPSGHHFYCKACITQYFKIAVWNEALFPPRCFPNTPIPPDPNILPPDLIAKYEAKKEEVETKDKTYCADKRCSAFIPTKNLDPTEKLATCPGCGTATCIICKAAAHEEACETNQEPEEELLHQLATDLCWKRCATCNRYVEVKTGCNQVV
jgi:hypothetical protein